MGKKNSNPFLQEDDVSDVTGVRLSDRLLQVGTDMGFMKKYVTTSHSVDDLDDVDYYTLYDKIFVKNEITDPLQLGKLGCINTGTISIFEDDDSKRAEITQMIEQNWPNANVWDLISNVGKVLVTDMKGPFNG